MNALSKNQLKNLAAYRLQKRCDEDEVFVVEGVKMCNEALMSDFTIRTLCGTAEYINSVNDKLTRCGEIYEVSAEQLERLSNQRTPNKVWMIVERRTENGERKTENGERRNGERRTESVERVAEDGDTNSDFAIQNPPKIDSRSKAQLRKDIREAQRKMQLAAKEMDFIAAARYRDEIRTMQAALDDARGE